MQRFLTSISLIFFGLFLAVGQRLPANADTLNYTSVLFSFPWIKGYDSYRIELENMGAHKVNHFYDCDRNKMVIDRLGFGQSYRWRYAGLTGNNEVGTWSDYQSFHIAKSEYVDTAFYKYKGKRSGRGIGELGLFFMDAGRVAVNRAGIPSFVLPELEFVTEKTSVRDLKMTHNGTLTALFDSSACEFTIDGKVLWMAPDNGSVSGDEREHYHHEFTKLPSGNYLVLGLEFVERTSPEGEKIRVEFGTIIEYGPGGEVVWSWSSKNYFSDQDLFWKKARDGSWDVNTHMNACTMDSMYVYAGYRDISRMIVIEKKSGLVVASYGGTGYPKEMHSGVGFFRRQHSAIRLSDGNFAVVNNDSVMDPNVVSSLVIFSPMSKNLTSKKIFEFKFDFDSLTDGKSVKTGNVEEMSNGNLLVNMGAINRCFEVTRAGVVIWSLFMERYDTNHRMILPAPQYRVHFTKSLYPYEMTARVLEDKTLGEERKIKLRLFNVGAKEDVYTIRLQAPEGQPAMVHRSSMEQVKSEQFTDVEFTLRENGPLDLRIDAEQCYYPLILHLEASQKF